MRSSNSHRNTIVTERNRTSRKQTVFWSNTTGGSVIIGGIAKEMQLLLVPVVPPSVVFSNQG